MINLRIYDAVELDQDHNVSTLTRLCKQLLLCFDLWHLNPELTQITVWLSILLANLNNVYAARCCLLIASLDIWQIYYDHSTTYLCKESNYISGWAFKVYVVHNLC